MVKESKDPNVQNEDTIDVIALLKQLWDARKLLVKIIVFFLCIGLFVALCSKDEYTTESTFVPLIQGESVPGSLGGLASLAGISLGGGVTNSEISPELYPQIVNSLPFKMELLDAPLRIKGQTAPISYRTYYTEVYTPGVLDYLKKYTIGLPSLIISGLKESTGEIVEDAHQTEILNISTKDNTLIEQIESQLNLSVNSKEGFVSIGATMPEATASAQLALNAQNLLQDYALKFKTQKSIEELEYLQDRYAETKQAFDAIKFELARFQDRNSGVNTALGRNRLLQLQSEYDLTFSVYTELAKQLEAQKLQVKKDTPLFTVLKPVSVPQEKSAPKKPLIVVIYLFLGLVVSVGYVLGKRLFLDFKREWMTK